LALIWLLAIMSAPIKYTMIGVDVAKLKLDIAIDDNKVLTIGNNEKGLKELLKTIPDSGQACFVMEATGGYERKLVRCRDAGGRATQEQLPVPFIQPRTDC